MQFRVGWLTRVPHAIGPGPKDSAPSALSMYFLSWLTDEPHEAKSRRWVPSGEFGKVIRLYDLQERRTVRTASDNSHN